MLVGVCYCLCGTVLSKLGLPEDVLDVGLYCLAYSGTGEEHSICCRSSKPTWLVF